MIYYIQTKCQVTSVDICRDFHLQLDEEHSDTNPSTLSAEQGTLNFGELYYKQNSNRE